MGCLLGSWAGLLAGFLLSVIGTGLGSISFASSSDFGVGPWLLVWVLNRHQSTRSANLRGTEIRHR